MSTSQKMTPADQQRAVPATAAYVIKTLESRSNLFSPNFMKRALAIYGHVLVIQLFVTMLLAFGFAFLAMLAAAINSGPVK